MTTHKSSRGRTARVTAKCLSAAALTIAMLSGEPQATAADPAPEPTANSDAPQLSNISRDNAVTVSETTSDGVTTSTVYTDPINYLEASTGDWKAIDNTLTQSPGEKYEYENSENSFRLRVPSNPAVSPFRISESGSWLELRLEGTSSSAPELSGEASVETDAAGTDGVVYEAQSTGLKESILLDAAPKYPMQYTYLVEASPDLSASLDKDGSVRFTKEDGTVRFEVPAGVMYESETPTVSSDQIDYLLDPQGAGWTLTVTPSYEWLSSPDRNYPVVVDPSVTTQPSNNCWINSDQPTTYHCGTNTTALRVGLNGTTKRRTLLNFDTSAIPAGVEVSEANLQLYLDSSSTTSVHSADYGLQTPKSVWTGSTNPTWQSSSTGAWNGACKCGSTIYGKVGLNGSSSGYKTFGDLEALVQKWIDGSIVNRGVLLKQTSEEVNTTLYFYSSSSDAANNGKRPKLSVTYTSAAPGKPTSLTISPGDGGVVESTTPTVEARIADPDGDPVALQISIVDSDSVTVFSGVSSQVVSGSLASLSIPSGVLEYGADYTLTAAATDGITAGQTESVEFIVDDPTDIDDEWESFDPAASLPEDSELLEEAFFSATVSCAISEGQVSTNWTVEDEFGVMDSSGAYIGGTVDSTIESDCYDAATKFVSDAIEAATSDAERIASLQDAIDTAETSAVTPPTLTYTWSGANYAESDSIATDDDGGSVLTIPSETSGSSCNTPDNVYSFIFGHAPTPRYIGMAEMKGKKLARFNQLRRKGKPCWYNWGSDGCSSPADWTAWEDTFLVSCYRHDWGYRNLKRAESWYDYDTWNWNNKAVSDTKLYFDAYKKCGQLYSGFTAKQCRDGAYIFYTAVAVGVKPNTFKDWKKVYVVLEQTS